MSEDTDYILALMRRIDEQTDSLQETLGALREAMAAIEARLAPLAAVLPRAKPEAVAVFLQAVEELHASLAPEDQVTIETLLDGFGQAAQGAGDDSPSPDADPTRAKG